VAVEKDPRITEVLGEQLNGLSNVTVVEGDVLKAELPEFNKVVAIPPYYLSSRLVTWLLERKVDCAVLILQREFANRLVAAIGSEDYGWLTVLACHDAKVELLDSVPTAAFYPQPKVESVIVRLTPWKTTPFNVKDEVFFNRLVRWLFTERNKKLGNALVPFFKSVQKLDKENAKKLAANAPFSEKRVRELAPREFGEVANAFAE
jgi:16S rRNA (adenine1518-N6/adenine1519-N6)-dimethyltransferase